MSQLNQLASDIIDYQKKHDLMDAAMAFNIHISVEALHNIKSGEQQPTTEQAALIQKYMNTKH